MNGLSTSNFLAFLGKEESGVALFSSVCYKTSFGYYQFSLYEPPLSTISVWMARIFKALFTS